MAKDPSPLVLRTERMHLLLPGPEAAPRLVAYFENNRDHLSPWEPPFPQGLFTKSFWERRLVQNRQEYRAGKSMRLVMLPKDNVRGGDVIGLANFTQFVRGAFMSCTLGYSLESAAQGKGYMYEALKEATRHVFGNLGMHRIMANYLPSNERSGKLLRRLGFEVEGYARDYIFINGAWSDHILTSLINSAIKEPQYVAKGTPR